MTNEIPAFEGLLNDIPAEWRPAVQAQLQTGENVLAALAVDLDAQLRFVSGLVVVTNQRLLSRALDGGWQVWLYRADLVLKHHDHAGVGHLELLDAQGRLASWRFTLGRNLYAIRLLDQFKIYAQSHVTGQPPAAPEGRYCPSCKAPLEPEQEECPVCAKVIHTPPSTWTLLRLWRFAQPYRGQLLLGFPTWQCR
jgi:ATP-binding cassette subfamily B protein